VFTKTGLVLNGKENLKNGTELGSKKGKEKLKRSYGPADIIPA
jgi:hypothetical protein